MEDDGDSASRFGEDFASNKKSKASWARLIAKIYEVNPMICPKCDSKMRVIAIIINEYEIKKIMKHLYKKGKSPPGQSVEDNNLLY